MSIDQVEEVTILRLNSRFECLFPPEKVIIYSSVFILRTWYTVLPKAKPIWTGATAFLYSFQCSLPNQERNLDTQFGIAC